jgi:putative glycosyltransferase (TIGR04372 family)
MKILINLHYIISGVFFVFLIKCISIFIEIKIGSMSRKGRESILISSLEPYLRELNQKKNHKQITLVIDQDGSHMNQALVSMYARRVSYIDMKKPFICRALYFACLILGEKSVNTINFSSRFGDDDRHLWEKCSPSIAFNKDEILSGKSLISDLSIDDYFCFGIRDDSYYQSILQRSKNSKIYNLEASKDTYFRNPSWEKYINVANSLASKDLRGLRMGKDVTSISDNLMGNNILDYSKIRDDFGDMYLLTHCKFLISGASGIFWFANLFNIPTLVADHYNVFCRGGGVSRNDLFIPSLIYSRNEKRLLFLSEMIDIGPNYTSSFFDKHNLELIKNDESEIYDGAKELESFTNKTRIRDDKAIYLNNKLDLIYKSKVTGMTYGGRIPDSFMIKYEKLIK